MIDLELDLEIEIQVQYTLPPSLIDHLPCNGLMDSRLQACSPLPVAAASLNSVGTTTLPDSIGLVPVPFNWPMSSP